MTALELIEFGRLLGDALVLPASGETAVKPEERKPAGYYNLNRLFEDR
jgi:hypothetical protein